MRHSRGHVLWDVHGHVDVGMQGPYGCWKTQGPLRSLGHLRPISLKRLWGSHDRCDIERSWGPYGVDVTYHDIASDCTVRVG